MFLPTFLLHMFLVFSCPHTTEALPLLGHKHHAIFAERNVCHENLTPVRPPALSHRAIAGPPAKHLTDMAKWRRKGSKSLSHFLYLQGCTQDDLIWGCARVCLQHRLDIYWRWSMFLPFQLHLEPECPPFPLHRHSGSVERHDGWGNPR